MINSILYHRWRILGYAAKRLVLLHMARCSGTNFTGPGIPRKPRSFDVYRIYGLSACFVSSFFILSLDCKSYSIVPFTPHSSLAYFILLRAFRVDNRTKWASDRGEIPC